METFLSIVDTLKCWIRTVFIVSCILVLLGFGWAFSILEFSVYVSVIFAVYDLVLLIRSAFFLFMGEEDEILSIIGTILELLVFVAVIVLMIILVINDVIFVDVPSLNICFMFVLGMLLHSWCVEIISLPLTIIGIFIDD